MLKGVRRARWNEAQTIFDLDFSADEDMRNIERRMRKIGEIQRIRYMSGEISILTPHEDADFVATCIRRMRFKK